MVQKNSKKTRSLLLVSVWQPEAMIRAGRRHQVRESKGGGGRLKSLLFLHVSDSSQTVRGMGLFHLHKKSVVKTISRDLTRGEKWGGGFCCLSKEVLGSGIRGIN